MMLQNAEGLKADLFENPDSSARRDRVAAFWKELEETFCSAINPYGSPGGAALRTGTRRI